MQAPSDRRGRQGVPCECGVHRESGCSLQPRHLSAQVREGRADDRPPADTAGSQTDPALRHDGARSR